ncbi:protein of unknown function [Xenorhabdus doucetiae]|uniref:Uncharacterized protein n=1 Tax=Xenorhabdus doucetiae TaxID=351671 RepID=A0A068QNN9_9GAMM|nr:protein of unknown function [Xenorhabdus doucetiae]
MGRGLFFDVVYFLISAKTFTCFLEPSPIQMVWWYVFFKI